MSAQARREQFVEAAIRVMSREGLERATTRRIAEEAGVPHGTFHYAFRDKNELLTEVVAAVARQIETILTDAVDPRRGLAAAMGDGLRAFWRHVVGDDGLQLMQYELMIFSRRTAGYEWLAEWQYARYTAAALEVLRRGAEHEAQALRIDLADLARFLVAAADGLVIQYEVTHDEQACLRDLEQVIRAGALLAGVTPERDGQGQVAEERGRGPSGGSGVSPPRAGTGGSRGRAAPGQQAAFAQRKPGGAAP